MKKHSRWAFVGVCGLAAVGTAVLIAFHEREKESLISSRMRSDDQRTVVAPAVGGEPPSQSVRSFWGSKDAINVVAIRAKYHDAERLPEFFEAGLRSPESGGLYYARQAYSDCAVARTEAHNRRDQVIPEALRLEIKRCEHLGGPESYERFSGVAKTSVAALDPLYSTMRGMQTAQETNSLTVASAQKAIETAVAYGDPYLLLTVQQRVVRVASAFDGQPLDDQLRSQLNAASLIASCDLGMACSAPAMTMLTCNEKDCSDSAIDIALPRGMNGEERSKISRLADRISSAARDGTLAQLWS